MKWIPMMRRGEWSYIRVDQIAWFGPDESGNTLISPVCDPSVEWLTEENFDAFKAKMLAEEEP